jgi:hypothetical protein
MQFKRFITRSVAIATSPRLAQVLGMFDIEPPAVSQQSWDVELQTPDNWNIDVIVGPSGSGKTTIARDCLDRIFQFLSIGQRIAASWMDSPPNCRFARLSISSAASAFPARRRGFDLSLASPMVSSFA